MSEPRYTYQSEYVKCGKKGCRSCPHGPYWYGYWREKGKLRKRYYGKQDPRERPTAETAESLPPDDPREKIFNRKTASLSLALSILGFVSLPDRQRLRAAFVDLVKTYHPDRGGCSREFVIRHAAYTYILACLDKG